MIHFIVYIISAYLIVGVVVYVWGHPLRDRIATPVEATRPEGKTNLLYRHLAHSAQAVNFLVHSVSSVAQEQASAPISTLYGESVRRAFDVNHLFITTGAPHSRGLYLRNFAWFYPDLLNPATIVDEADRENRTILLERSLSTALGTMGARPYTTTIVPLTARRFAAVNYVTPPSDSLLGILAGLEQLTHAPGYDGRNAASLLIARHKNNIERELKRIAAQLTPVIANNKKYLLLDARKNMSSATDTRDERMRFVVSANVWTTLAKAERLGFMDGNVFAAFGLDKVQYKKDILELFGSGGYICNTIDPAESAVAHGSRETDNITLDFAHVHRGFWDLSQLDEQILFKNTVDLIFSDPTFRDISANCYFVSNKNPDCDFLHRYTTPSYHGRTVWSSFNVELADRLLDLACSLGDETYRYRAERILLQLKEDTERNGGYPELIDADGTPYRTWIYKSAVADSWFPRFAGVWHKAFNVKLDKDPAQ
jgi:hypothetical protein